MASSTAFDLIVVGGGTAGALSAIAAARKGLKVAVVERGACLGGIATNSGLTEMNAASFHADPLYGGIEQEILDHMIQNGDAEYHFAVPMSSNPEVKVDRLRYNPEMLKLLLESTAVDSGVTLYYDAELTAAQEGDQACQVQVRGRYEQFTLEASYLIDGTGNATLVQALGGETVKAPREQQMVATLMFRLSNVELEPLNAFIHSDGLKQTVQAGYDQGILKGKILAFTPIPGTRDVSLNVTRAKFDCEDTLGATNGIIQARAQIQPVLQFVRACVPGLEHAYISNIASMMGVRDARRIVGQYTLTIQDLEQMTQFEDSVACGCYPMDIHDPVTNSVIWKLLPGVYHIPYRCLLPKGLHRTLAASKCLCAQRQAFAALRMIPILMNLGESAGYAVALAKEKGAALDALDPTELSRYLNMCYQR